MNNVDVGGYYEEDEYNDGYGGETEGNPSFDRNDKVAKALSDVTTAPNELADYVKLLVSTHSQTSEVSDINLVREIGKTLTKDGMVTSSGRKLDVAVSMAVNSILGKNIKIDYDENESVEKKQAKHNRKQDRDESNEQPYQKKSKTPDSSRNYRSNIKNDNNYSYKERRGHQSNQHTQTRNHDNGSYAPRYSNGSNLPPHNPSQRGGPPHSHTPNYGHSRSRPLPPPPPPQRGPPHMHEMNSNRNAPPPYRQNRRDPSPGGYNNNDQYAAQGNGSGSHIRNGSNIPPPPPPPPPNHKHHTNYPNNKRSNPHMGQGHGPGYGGRTNDQKHPPSRNMNSVPPPPPPPPTQSHHPRQQSRSQTIPENERRTIFLSKIPPQISYNQLLSYFTRKMNVIVNTLQLQPMSMDQNYNKNNNRAKQENKAQKAYVELATHDQAMFIYHNPDPILGNRFIGIEMHPVNLNTKGNKSISNPASQFFDKNTLQNSYQHPPKEKPKHSSKPTMQGDMGAKVRTPSPEDQKLLETHQKKKILLQKKESLLEARLVARKKEYSVLKQNENGSDSTVKLKEILVLQKSLNQSKKESFDILSKISDLEKKIAAQVQIKHFSHSHNQEPKRYSLDKRTTTVEVTNFPDDTTEDALTRHFNAFGKVTSVKMHDNSANVTFANRIFAERAKNNATFFNDSTLVLEWHNKDWVGSGTNATTKGKDKEEKSLQVDSTEISEDGPTEENVDLGIKEEEEEEDLVVYNEEARWR